MFRNTRATIAGFPPRTTHLSALTATSSTRREAIANEWDDDTALARESHNASSAQRQAPLSFAHDPRIEWLVPLLQTLAPQKVLLICRTRRKALAIESALRLRTTIPLGAFHEGLTLVQRDRGAASFADPDGARLLICSEIGSEGRNFQFAHHLVLFDLPLDPALVEQRIGRLDRIGQREPIHLHVPYVAGTHLEVLARWYHEGLDAFQTHLPGARELLEQFEPELRVLCAGARHDRRRVGAELEGFLASVRAAKQRVTRRLEEGRDRLLEWNSLRPALSTHIADEIRRQDEDTALDEFMLSLFDLFVVQVEEVAPRTYRLGSAGVLVDDFPGLKADGLTCTRDRQRALRREDLQFLTWDHPLATGALDMLLGSERGNCSFVRWIDPAASVLYLDVLYVLECPAPAALHVDRFLPPTPIRTAVDHRGRDALEALASMPVVQQSHHAEGKALIARSEIRETLLPRLVDRAQVLAEARIPALVEQAQRAMHAQLDHEIGRLRELRNVNRSVRDEEVALLVEQRAALDAAIGGARLRLDAVRLVYRGKG
jgi:ATP-dependent helicase HepA